MDFHFIDDSNNQQIIDLGDNISLLIEKQSRDIATLICISTMTHIKMAALPKDILVYNITNQTFIKAINHMFILNWMHDYIIYYNGTEITLINKREWNISVNK